VANEAAPFYSIAKPPKLPKVKIEQLSSDLLSYQRSATVRFGSSLNDDGYRQNAMIPYTDYHCSYGV
jgi:hypothetical protein